MKKAKRLISLLVVFALVFALAACGSSSDTSAEDTAAAEPAEETTEEVAEAPAEEEPAETEEAGSGESLKIAYSTVAYSIALAPTFIWDKLEELVEDEGWEFMALAAEGDYNLQDEQISTLIQQEPDYFVCFIGDSELGVDSIARVAEAGIPVILVANPLADDTDVVTLCTYDNYTMGQLMAQWIADEQGADSGLNIAEIAGVPVQQDYIDRVSGFEDYIADNTNFNIIGQEWAYSSRADAQTYAENFINTYGDSLDVIAGFDDDLTLGAVNAVQAAGKGDDIMVVSMTGQIDAFDAIRSGTLAMTVRADYTKMLQTVIDTIKTLESGGTVADKVQYTDLVCIDSTNCYDYEGEF